MRITKENLFRTRVVKEAADLYAIKKLDGTYEIEKSRFWGNGKTLKEEEFKELLKLCKCPVVIDEYVFTE